MQLKITRPKDMNKKDRTDFDNMIRDRVWHGITGRGMTPIGVIDPEDKKGVMKDLYLFSDKNMLVNFEGGDFRVMNVQAKYLVTKQGEKPDANVAKTFYGTVDLTNDMFITNN